jgi:Type II secretion system (T2SS), protein M
VNSGCWRFSYFFSPRSSCGLAFCSRSRRDCPRRALGSPIAAFVSSSASEAGFTLSHADPVGPDAVIVALTTAKSPAFFAWVDIMQRRGVFVERAAINTNSDATIRVDATFKASAR